MTEQMSANPEDVDRRKFLTGIIGVVAGAVAVVVGVPTDRLHHLPRRQAGKR